MFASIIGGVVSGVVSVIPGLANVIGNVIIKKSETEAARQGKQDERGEHLAIGWLQSVVETEGIKAKTQTERQIVAGLLFFALPTGIIFWAALLDGIPFRIPLFMTYPHIVGSWGIVIPTEFRDDMKMIIQSFFIGGSTIAGAKILASAFRR